MAAQHAFRALAPAWRRAALGLATAAAVTLAGCASQPMQAPPPIGSNLKTEQNHAYTGRFAVQYSDSYGNPRNVYGNFDWQENGPDISLELRSPLGQTLAIVKSSPGGATLELPHKAPQVAPDVGGLMQHALGFALPLDGLRYWLLPTPSPDSPATTVRDAQNSSRIKEIRQDGWTIDYLSYAAAPASGVKLVKLVRDTPPLDIKLVLDR